jgi:hypothetical protein
MGGSPKIDGGMTLNEQQTLMREEREFQKQQEVERRAAAEATEARRVQREAADRDRLKREEEAAIMQSTQAEQTAIDEAAAQTEAQTKGTVGAANAQSLDFLGSLYTGINVNKLY